MAKPYFDCEIFDLRTPSPVPPLRASMRVGGYDASVLHEMFGKASPFKSFSQQFPDWIDGFPIACAIVRHLKERPHPALSFDSLSGTLDVFYDLDSNMAGVPNQYVETISVRLSEALDDFGLLVVLEPFRLTKATSAALSMAANMISGLVAQREREGRGTIAECFARRIGVYPFVG